MAPDNYNNPLMSLLASCTWLPVLVHTYIGSKKIHVKLGPLKEKTFKKYVLILDTKIKWEISDARSLRWNSVQRGTEDNLRSLNRFQEPEPGIRQIDQVWGWFCEPGLTIYTYGNFLWYRDCLPMKTRCTAAKTIHETLQL